MVEKSTYLTYPVFELASCQVSNKCNYVGYRNPALPMSDPVLQHTVRLGSKSRKRGSKKVHTSHIQLSSWQAAKFQTSAITWATVTRLSRGPIRYFNIPFDSSRRAENDGRKKYIPPDSNSRVGKLPSFKQVQLRGLP